MSAILADLLPDEMMKNDMAYRLGLEATSEGLEGVHVSLARGKSISDEMVQAILEDHPMDFYLYFPFRAARIKSEEEETKFREDFLKRRNHRLSDGYTLLAVLVFGHLTLHFREELKLLFKKDVYDLAVYSSFKVEGTALLIHWGVYEGILAPDKYLPLATRHEVPSALLTHFKEREQ